MFRHLVIMVSANGNVYIIRKTIKTPYNEFLFKSEFAIILLYRTMF